MAGQRRQFGGQDGVGDGIVHRGADAVVAGLVVTGEAGMMAGGGAGLMALAAGAVGGVAMKSGPFCPQPAIIASATTRPARPCVDETVVGTSKIWNGKTMNGL